MSGLQDPKDPAFKRYFYLLENLAYVKSFNMCFELEDCQEIFCRLFQLMFEIVKWVSFIIQICLVYHKHLIYDELLFTVMNIQVK